MQSSLVARILHAYGIAYQHIHEPQKGYRNQSFCVETSTGKLNVMLYKSEPGMAERVRRANLLGGYLAEQGLPARQPFSPKILKLQGARTTKFAAIYYYLPGHTIPWEAYTMAHIKALGAAMGQVHTAARASGIMLPHAIPKLQVLHTRMRHYFTDAAVVKALQQKLGLRVAGFGFRPVFGTLAQLPAHPLHMDFVRGNIVFEGTRLTGILDFEKAANGPPVLDLARTLAFLLVDCKYKQEPKIRKYFLQSGYAKRGGQLLPEPQSLEPLVTFFLLYDFYKFLRHNPYESLPGNEHFMRTRAILLQRGLIRVK